MMVGRMIRCTLAPFAHVARAHTPRSLVHRSLLPLAIASLLSGCSLVPDFLRPEIPQPAGWESNLAPRPAAVPETWWQGFNQPELTALMTEALERNNDLRAATARIRQAEQQIAIGGAALWPSLTATGTATQQKQASVSSTGTSTSVSTSSSANRQTRPQATTIYQGTLAASYQLDLFGATRASVGAAEERLRASSFDRETVRLTLASNVATSYFQLLSARDRTRLARETLKAAEAILAQLEAQRSIGTVSDLELAQQRSAVASQRAAIPAFALSERQALDALAVLLGRGPGLRVEAQSLSHASLPDVVADLPSTLLERRPDIAKAEADLRAANFDIGAARAGRLPTLSLTAQGGTISKFLSDLMTPGSYLYSLAASLSAPLFQGGKLEAQEKLARAKFDELAAAYGAAVVDGFRDVEDALGAIEQTRLQYEFSRAAFEQARAAHDLANARFRLGAIDFITVLETQRSMLQAQDAMAQADLARFNGMISLYTALGGGFDAASVRPAN